VYEERRARSCLDEAWDLAKVLCLLLFYYSTAHGNGAVGFPVSSTDPRGEAVGALLPVSRLLKAQPCLQVTQVMNPLQGACWL